MISIGPKDAYWTVVLAHGAGVGMHSKFMVTFAKGLSERGIHVIRFEFPYMSKLGSSGRRIMPDRESTLIQTWLAIVKNLRGQNVVIGGKSLGGRIASMLADEIQVDGLICLGYPFHTPGALTTPKRTGHLATLSTPTLICQGTRDRFGTIEDVAKYSLSPSIKLHWLKDGDHDFQPRRSSGLTTQENWESAITAITKFVDCLSAKNSK